MAKRNIALSELHTDCDDAPDLDPADYDGQILIDCRLGHVDIVDGFHRSAGLRGWAEGEGLSLDSVTVPVVDVSDAPEHLVGAAGCPDGYRGVSQRDAIAQLLRDYA